MPVYIEKVEIWSGVTDASQTDRQTSELDPVGSTVRYEMMKLCTGSV